MGQAGQRVLERDLAHSSAADRYAFQRRPGDLDGRTSSWKSTATGFVEETHFTIAYSPVPDETAPQRHRRGAGHRARDHREGGRRATGRGVTGPGRSSDARRRRRKRRASVAAKTRCSAAKDIPFALIYLLDADGKRARLAGAAGVGGGSRVSPTVLELGRMQRSRPGRWPRLVRTETSGRRGSGRPFRRRVPPGPWSDPPRHGRGRTDAIEHRASARRISGRRGERRLRLDEHYRSFYRAGRRPDRDRASPTPAPTRRSANAPRRWPSSTAPRRPSSATSATSSARR